MTIATRPDPDEKITWRGKTVDRRLAVALAVAEQRLGYNLTLVQGSFNAGGVSASGGTHDGGGVVDLSAYDRKRKVRVLRDLGFAVWYRPAIAGLWGEHIHAVLIGDPLLSAAAAAQVLKYLDREDGLSGHNPDPNPYRPHPPAVFSYTLWWRDQLLEQRITGLTAHIRALQEKRAAARTRITYR